MAFAAAAPASAQEAAGAYLAGRAATYDSNFAAAANYYTRALVRDPQNAVLMENVVFAQMALGQLKRAHPVAQRMWDDGINSQIANMVMVGGFAQAQDYQALLDRDPEKQGIGPLVDGLVTAWAQLGAGNVTQALAEFDRVAEDEGLRLFARYHRALALASIGEFDASEALFAADDGRLSKITRRAVLARVQVLSQLGRNEQAMTFLTDAFGSQLDPALSVIYDRLAGDETLPFLQAATVTDGIAEVFYTVASALSGEAANDYVLVYARMAAVLSPSHMDSILLSADLLEKLGRYDLSVATYKLVQPGHPDYHAAELGRAEALRRAAKPDAAIEVLEQLTREVPNQPNVYSSLGDLLRQQEDYAGAVAAYDTALSILDQRKTSSWFILYARGISLERLDQWDRAEADFRAALVLNPDRPEVLNYLGYSLVEKQIKLDEALSMIQRAVKARPDSGYIRDSLGWVLYRLGRYGEASAQMERAAALMPVDPVVNDHLGDVFWAVGRYREAEFQWKRALSFVDPEDLDSEADPERIRRKLEIGLDQVLADEGAEPLKLANDG
ncbi:tetratricopeptide repeat protein [Parasedimentitalea psychrophila]|uniref:Tetratricopeptide repeat protein n=1 Tax=Parasedimentitalea psychrophila TaxID=2997337 RepID=A0A9Y2L0W7_9RHOB|nr:tetratricopeptide repeat protein [Parasedimentitalea psychrophila]WIY26263.1 tetratricopeptide repeat protein [Parasedimentitalea psychrophila]